MIKDFSLLATTMRGTERQASNELDFLLQKIGDSQPTICRTGIRGLITAKTSLNPVEAVDKLRQILNKYPYEFRYTMRIIPIEKVVRTDIEEIRVASAAMGAQIAEAEKFRITVEKRFNALSSKTIIEEAAKEIKRQVDLSKPDRILLIEVVGEFTGLSLIKPNGVLAVLKEKAL
jgi:tRNA acetyltransferase TAN1